MIKTALSGAAWTATLILCCLTPAAWSAEWPNMTVLNELPEQLMDVPSLENSSFIAEVLRIEQEILSEPTNRENSDERATVARQYYNALQADGVLVPGIALIAANVVQALSKLPDQLYLKYLPVFDDLFLSLRQAHRLLDAYGPSALGRIDVVEPRNRSLHAREYATIRVVYRVGKVPLKEGARIRFSGNWMNDMSPFQSSRPHMPGYTTVHTSNPAVKLARGMENWLSVFGTLLGTGAPRPAVTVIKGRLVEGDTITFVIGDTTQGGPGLLVQSATTDAFPIRFEIDHEGQGHRFVVVGEPRFEVYGSAPHHLRVVAPSTVHPAERFTIRVSVEDRYFNRATNGPKRLSLWLDGKKIAEARALRSDRAIFHFGGLVLPGGQAAPAVYEAREERGPLYGRSNPVHVIGPDERHLFWGDLHAHEGYTDGTGTAEWVMRYARDVAFLDFVGLTGHDLMMSELYQRDVQRVTDRYNDPPRFVAFKAYEWTQAYPLGGHHNVYYRDALQRIIPCYEAETIADLYRSQREVNDTSKALIIPHAHEPGDWNFNDAQMSRLVEIYSMHGSFEWFGQRFLERGYHMGLIASSDDHTGHPGNNPVRKSQRGGLVAVFAGERTREAIFDALVARRTYGTTLARIVLDARVAGAVMGSEIELEERDNPVVEVSGIVSGTAPIARVAVVCNGKDSQEINLLERHVTTSTEGKAALRVMITNTTEPETKGTQILPPLLEERWWGRITLTKAAVLATTPLGLDTLGDTFTQSGQRRVDFAFGVTGDRDGLLLELDQWRSEDTLEINIFESTRTTVSPNHGSKERALWGEVVTTPRATVQIRFSELEQGPVRCPFTERSAVLAERVGAELSSYHEFSFSLRDDLKRDDEDYVYVRAEQIDDEVAWSSPVWITWR